MKYLEKVGTNFTKVTHVRSTTHEDARRIWLRFICKITLQGHNITLNPITKNLGNNYRLLLSQLCSFTIGDAVLNEKGVHGNF